MRCLNDVFIYCYYMLIIEFIFYMLTVLKKYKIILNDLRNIAILFKKILRSKLNAKEIKKR